MQNHATRPRSECGQGAMPICDRQWLVLAERKFNIATLWSISWELVKILNFSRSSWCELKLTLCLKWQLWAEISKIYLYSWSMGWIVNGELRNRWLRFQHCAILKPSIMHMLTQTSSLSGLQYDTYRTGWTLSFSAGDQLQLKNHQQIQAKNQVHHHDVWTLSASVFQS